MLPPESRRASSASPLCSSPAPPRRWPLGSPHASSDPHWCFSAAPPCRRPLGSPHASSYSPRCFSAAPPCRRPLVSPHATSASPWLCARRQRRSTHEAPTFKVGEGGLFLVADAHHARFLCLASVFFSCSPSSPAAWRPLGGRKLPREADRCTRTVHVQSRRRICARRKSRSAHEASAFKVDEGDLFLVADVYHGGPQAAAWLLGSKRPLLYSRRSRPSWRPQAAAWLQAIPAAHASHGGRRRPRGGRVLPLEKV